MSTERIIERVRKMLALANDAGASEGERDNALRMAHSTLAKYNLSLAQVEASGRGSAEARGRLTSIYYARPWARVLSNSIADLFYSYYVFGGSHGDSKSGYHYFIGLESNAKTASEMSAWLVKCILTESRKFGKRSATARRSFAFGAVSRIAERVVELKKTPQSEDTSHALVAWTDLEKQRNAEWAESHMKIKTDEVKAKDIDYEAAHHGRRYGDSVQLHRQLDQKTNRQLEGN